MNINIFIRLSLLLIVISTACTGGLGNFKLKKVECLKVQALIETEIVDDEGDAADDIAIWVHPDDPSRSLIIGTNKKAGIHLYDLDGRQLQFLALGKVNNVDLRHGFTFSGKETAIVAVSNRTTNSIDILSVDKDSLRLIPLSVGNIRSSLDQVYGLCMYKSKHGKFYVFVNSKSGNMEQWELFVNENDSIEGAMVRNFRAGLQTEGCVADDELGYLYVSDENTGIVKFFADPDIMAEKRIVADTNHLIKPQIEGLALYYGKSGSGYLIASLQHENRFAIFERGGTNKFIGCFSIEDGDHTDGTKNTDGIEVVNAALNTNFPKGLFVAQDGFNKEEGVITRQNFKLVPWERIAESFSPPLIMEEYPQKN